MRFIDELNKKVIIFDGAFGTELVRRGVRTGVVPELINLENPEIVSAIHRDYIAHGADVITTNTFGLNRIKYRGKFSIQEVAEAAIQNARSAGKRTGETAWSPHPGRRKICPLPRRRR